MSLMPMIRRQIRRQMVNSGLTREATFTIGGRSITYAPVRRQSRLLDQLVDDGIWSYEPELAAFVYANPFGSAHFVDGGTHIGLFSAFAECSGRYQSVTAIEAAPETAAYVRNIAGRNGFKFAVHECALGDGAGTITFEIPETGYAMPSHSAFSVSDLYKEQRKRKIDVETRPLASFIGAGASLVKLDCEGAEEAILAAALPSLGDRSDVDFIVEIMINDANKERVFGLMRSAGYLAYLMTNGGLVREDRPLTLPVPGSIPKRGASRTIWRNHLFSKRSAGAIERASLELYHYFP